MTQPASKRFVMEDKLNTELALKADIDSPSFTGGATVSTGDAIVSSGNIVVTSGYITATAGSIVATTGGLRAGSSTALSSLSTGHALQAGPTTGQNVRIGNNGINAAIQAVNNGSYSTLDINTLGGVGGGAVNIGTSAGTVTASGPLVSTYLLTANMGITTGAGNGSIAQIKIPAGTLLTTPAQGVIESDANAIYGTTNATHGRGAIPVTLASIGTNTFVSAATAQALFPAATDTLAMAANTTYLVEGLIAISVPAASSVAHTMTFTLNGGTAATTGQYMAFTTQNNTSSATSATSTQWMISATTAAAIFPTASTAATAVYRQLYFRGIVRCAAAGTFIPQITTSVATVAVPAGVATNHITLTPIGSNTVASIGAWS